MITTATAGVPLYLLAFLFCLALTATTVKRLIPMLGSKAKQPIYDQGPAWHLKKTGTPTMGGLGYLIAISLILTLAIVYLFLTGERYFAISIILTASDRKSVV